MLSFTSGDPGIGVCSLHNDCVCVRYRIRTYLFVQRVEASFTEIFLAVLRFTLLRRNRYIAIGCAVLVSIAGYRGLFDELETLLPNVLFVSSVVYF